MLTWRREHMSAHQPANSTDTDPHGHLHGATAKWDEWIGPTGIVGPISGIVRGGILGLMGDTKR